MKNSAINVESQLKTIEQNMEKRKEVDPQELLTDLLQPGQKHLKCTL